MKLKLFHWVLGISNLSHREVFRDNPREITLICARRLRAECRAASGCYGNYDMAAYFSSWEIGSSRIHLTYDSENYDPRMAALLAVHLVGQVLDEAYVIANAAEDSGQPWSYLQVLKNLRCGKIPDATMGDISFLASKGDSDSVNENKEEHAANIVATSTPHKDTDEANKPRAESSFIGQGDEQFNTRQNDLSNSTSMFINHLFDMSDAERVVICDDSEVTENNPVSNDVVSQAMTKIMESYVNAAFNIAFGQDLNVIKLIEESNKEIEDRQERSTDNTCYSFLANAFGTDIGKDLSFYVVNNAQEDKKVTELEEENVQTNLEEIEELREDNTDKSDRDHYEIAYLTMNRDYEQCSDDDGDPILQDPKGLIMQEVELLTANTSENNLTSVPEPKEDKKELAAVSGVSAMSGSRKSKSSLASRCRSQGARLLACLRGWWRRKTPGKRKENRGPGSIRGICPLSPDARRRATSLLGKRQLCSPSPSRSVVWKFNTVSEAFVASSHWKEYALELKRGGCVE